MRDRKFGHVVNVVTWGVQMKAPKFTAYIASKAALDTFSRIAGRETWFDNVTFTDLRLDLAHGHDRRDRRLPQGAREVTGAGSRPGRARTGGPTRDHLDDCRRVGEVLNLVAPRLMDARMGLMGARRPDSPAARAHVGGDSRAG
jgi:NAD(P)-dependent dehydrogenase (short-subunit alcohol dehydrogenase family)